MKVVVVKLELDEKVLQSIAFVKDKAAGKHSRGKREATRAEVHQFVADALTAVESQALALLA